MNTTPPKPGRHSPGQSNKARTHHEFGTLEDMSLWHDPAAPCPRYSELNLGGPKASDCPDSECTRVM